MNPPRKRAPGMSPEQRRDMIVQVALPLVAEYGSSVSTQQIARAAGIGEATIFRAFEDKDTLLRACVAEAIRPDRMLTELASISLDDPLRERLVQAADALTAYLGRMGAVVGALYASGALQRERPEPPAPENSREESLTATSAALAELLEPDSDRLRLPAYTLASWFGFVVMALSRSPGWSENEPVLDVNGAVDLFLHGALRPGEREAAVG
ncbi:TetR/AcrR family transcriptional regulator [Pseudonocardia acaciae]|uniref:TetR/AcrR family transcriptional regulator n=1 Tax=Pseudonocardia acaciae TaxID=551276 RepID=UPI001FDF984F|nr:TetR/AcrR family transcriptional regulator [Pseudonocardia acaciae]